ncbi:MAG: hypothetical protein ACI3YI_05590, partial [Bacteroidaceae bacterium]
GKASTTIRLQAIHTADGSEKIIGFDNVTITSNTPDGITASTISTTHTRYYDLQGRAVHHPSHGIYIKKQGNKQEKIWMTDRAE